MPHDPAYAGYEDITTAYIKGGKAYKEGKAKTIEGIHVLDDRTIKITTEKVSAKSPLLLGGQVLSEAYYGKNYRFGKLDYLKELYAKPIGADLINLQNTFRDRKYAIRPMNTIIPENRKQKS